MSRWKFRFHSTMEKTSSSGCQSRLELSPKITRRDWQGRVPLAMRKSQVLTFSNVLFFPRSIDIISLLLHYQHEEYNSAFCFSPVTDLSNSISYTPQRACSSGFQYSSKSLEFPNASYTPLTAYVLDYRPVAASGGAPQAATQKQTGQEHRAPPNSTNQKQTGQEHRAPPNSTNQKQTGQEHRAPPNSTNQKQTGQEHRPSPSAPPMAEKKQWDPLPWTKK